MELVLLLEPVEISDTLTFKLHPVTHVLPTVHHAQMLWLHHAKLV